MKLITISIVALVLAVVGFALDGYQSALQLAEIAWCALVLGLVVAVNLGKNRNADE
ncbi:MAG: hypothetical protein NVS9B4_00290 [Candidatus Acidiferrum sp.]